MLLSLLMALARAIKIHSPLSELASAGSLSLKRNWMGKVGTEILSSASGSDKKTDKM